MNAPPKSNDGSAPGDEPHTMADALLDGLVKNQLAAQTRFRVSELIPGSAYVLTRDIYQSEHCSDGVARGQLVRVFREGDRFVCNTGAAEHDVIFALTPLNLALSIGARDGTWEEIPKHVREIPHTEETLEALRKADEYDRESWGDEDGVGEVLS